MREICIALNALALGWNAATLAFDNPSMFIAFLCGANLICLTLVLCMSDHETNPAR